MVPSYQGLAFTAIKGGCELVSTTSKNRPSGRWDNRPKPPAGFVTTTEAVEILGRSKQSIYRLVQSGKPTPCQPQPRMHHFFRRDEVEALARRM
jgi:hypothetical protein